MKEAERNGRGEKLGPLGSRLVAEVLLGGVFYGPAIGKDAYVAHDEWKALVTDRKSERATFHDVVRFVVENS